MTDHSRIAPAASGKVSRRGLLAGAAAGSAVIASPAIAQSMPEVKWRMPLFVPKTVDSVMDAVNGFTKRVAEATDGKFQIQSFGAGELVPGGPAVLDAAEQGTTECAFTLSYYSFGKDPAYAYGSTLPFGFNTRGQASWLLRGGGMELCNEFFNARGTHAIPVGNSTAQMGGFFRKEINKVEDLKGLKMRIPGLGGAVLAKLGVIPQQIPPGEIYPALEKGVIDAAEWAGPYDDLKMGLHRVAKFYYGPGWWEPQATIMFFSNLKKWQELPKLYQSILETAALATWTSHVSFYDSKNGQGLRELLQAGTQVRFFSKEILDASYDAAFQVYEELKGKSPAFAKIYPSWRKHLDDVELYYRVGDSSFDNYVQSRRVRG